MFWHLIIFFGFKMNKNCAFHFKVIMSTRDWLFKLKKSCAVGYNQHDKLYIAEIYLDGDLSLNHMLKFVTENIYI